MSWLNFDKELQKRLGYSANGGVRQKSVPRYEWLGAGRDGLAQRQTGYNQINDIGYYRDNEDWQKVSNALGISSVNSMNDINQMLDFVNQGRYGSASRKEEKEEEVNKVDNPNVTQERNEPAVSYNSETVEVEGTEGTNQQSHNKQDTSTTGFDPNNISSFHGRSDRFGMKDLKAAFTSGYSQGDVMRHLNSLGHIDGDSGGYLAGGALDQGLRETSMGKISTQFVDPSYNPYGSTGWDRARQTFGHFDLLANRKAGFSDNEILNYLDNNLDKLNPAQRKGVAGGIYEQLNAMRPTEPIPAKSLMVGGSNLGNAGYADAITPNRSAASSSTRSSYGTSQFNRANFGNKKKSGITSLGLNI